MKIYPKVNGTLILNDNDSLYGCGDNYEGQLGLGYKRYIDKLEQLNNMENVEKIVCGYTHTVILKKDHTVWSYGWNRYGQLGLGDTKDRLVPTQLNLNNVKDVFVGGYHTFAICENGDVFSWGYNGNGQLGLSEKVKYSSTPTKIDIENIMDIVLGGYHSLIKVKGINKPMIYACGRNKEGQLGTSDFENRFTFEKIDMPNFKKVYAGMYNTFIISSKDKVFDCGFNKLGQLGVGHKNNICKFEKTLIIEPVYKIVLSYHHTAYITNKKELFFSGYLDINPINENFKTMETPLKLDGFSDIVDISTRFLYSFIITSKGEVFAFGNNFYGQLGLGDTIPRNKPKKIDIEGVTSIYSEKGCVYANTSNGLYCWGEKLENNFNSKKEKTLQLSPKKINIF